MSIIISQNGKGAEKIDKSDFDREDYLQEYIHKNPDAIPVYELKEDKKLLVLKREFPTNAGPIDALAIDRDGDIYIVETKLFKNPDKRTVVAQALDYGAALWKHFNDFNKFTRILNEEIENKFNISLEEKIKDFFSLDDEGLSFILGRMKNNLDDGSLKFVILMNSIEERLRDLILYVNQNSQFDVYAVEMEYYKYDKYEIMIPRIFGVEVRKNLSTQTSARSKWDETSFIKEVKKLPEKESQKLIDFYSFLKDKSDNLIWGTGVNVGSVGFVFDVFYKSISPLSIYSNGKFEVKFNWIYTQTYDSNVKKYAHKFFDELKEQGINVSEKAYNLEETFRLQKEDFFKNYDKIFSALRKSIF